MKQRLALAHSLIGSPRLLVFDEPTNGLDPDGIQDIRRLLSTLPETAGCTIFFASHYLDEVEKTATHLAVLRDGSIHLQASVLELTQRLASVLVLEVDDAAQGAGILQSLGYAAETDGQNHVAVSGIDRNDAGRVHTYLMQAGVVLYQSTLRKPSLEQWFLQTAFAGGEKT